jgi:hypothetical protein
MPPLALTEWHAQQLRLSAFPVVGGISRSTEWWEAATGGPPEENTVNPRKGIAAISGAVGQGKLVLGWGPDRIDWLHVPPDPDPEMLGAIPEFPQIGALPEVIGTFSDIVERWLVLEDIPELARLAFGAILQHPEPDRRSGYQRLPDYVPVRINLDSTDFLYQINLPVASRTGIANLQINRLSKWSVGAFARFAMTLTSVGGLPQPITRGPLFAFRVELDINTAPALESPLPRAQLVDVYRELVDVGQNIAAEGVADR